MCLVPGEMSIQSRYSLNLPCPPQPYASPRPALPCLERVVVADDAACLGAVLVGGNAAVGQVAQPGQLLLDVQDVGVGVHALGRGGAGPASVCGGVGGGVGR